MIAKCRKLYFLFIIALLPSCTLNLKAEPEIYIRYNQIGFFPNDYKSAIVLAYNDLSRKEISILNSKTRKTVSTLEFGNNHGTYGNFKYTYIIDFSKITSDGEYYFQFAQQKTSSFKIGYGIFSSLADSLLQFFKVQRCGYTDPSMHKVCHIADATSIIDGHQIVGKGVDVTGGWHDAGDYVKFLNTTAYATYMLLFSYDFDPSKFSFDDNKNNVPDILEEAKVGLDWMLRCYYKNDKLVTQVQDLRDHDVGWRMPEEDALGFDRPAFVGMGKNLIGIYSATMALAARIWKDKLQYPEFANKCLDAATSLYSIRDKAENVDSSGTGSYLDKTYLGKIALGAVELYKSTGVAEYLSQAKKYADLAGSDYWWSWGDVNVLAHYRLAQYDQKYAEYISKNLDEFNKKKNENLFGKAAELSWGTNMTLMGVALQNILYKKIVRSATYDTLATLQRDFIFGRNPWGVCFINGFGKNYSRNFHHQISFLKGKLRGGFAAGPATKEFIDKYKIKYDRGDKYSKFQSEDMYYRDDRQDYITNEPTISGNATAIFVFGIGIQSK
jgi:endoglucanase